MLYHKHTAIILRRFFFLFGTVYFYRIITVPVNVLPVPPLPEGHCMPPTDGSWAQILGRVFGVLGGGGMSITGKTLCGDYIYSGHACLLTISSLFVLEYSPKHWWVYHYFIGVDYHCIFTLLNFFVNKTLVSFLKY